MRVRDRWKCYFKGLYNDSNPVDGSHLPMLPQYAKNEIIPGISIEEVETAVKKLGRRKAPGPDEISAEEILAAKKGLQVIHEMCNNVWKSKQVPD